MGQFNLNLSTRPYKPYRAVNLGLMILLLVLIAVSAGQVYTYQQNSSFAATIRGDQLKNKEEADQLRKEVGLLRDKMYSGNAATKMTEVEFLNQLLKRKSFSWTTVFANLEEIMPENVYLLNLRPFVDEKGQMGLNIDLRGRTFADAQGFVKTLESSRIFSEIAVAAEEKKDALPMGEVELTLSTYYVPAKKGAE